jgi:hypothetical protein
MSSTLQAGISGHAYAANAINNFYQFIEHVFSEFHFFGPLDVA